ncbi:MAG: site-specific DNA-methyltransferase [Pseudomonadota bacterium]
MTFARCAMDRVEIRVGDCRQLLRAMPDQSVHCIVTSPPYYGLRDYGVDGQIGLEKSPKEFVDQLVDVFTEAHRVLRDDGTAWMNLGDSYASAGGPGWQGKNGQRADRRFTGSRNNVAMREASRSAVTGDYKPKDLMGMPWRVAFALQAAGWYLRQDIIWAKPNPMPESVRDRCTKAHEYLFLLTKSAAYTFDSTAIREPAVKTGSPGHLTPGAGSYQNERRTPKVERRKTFRGGSYINGSTFDNSSGGKSDSIGNECTDDLTRNKRSVWTVATRPFSGAHFATFPPDLIEPCILAGCPKGGTVLDPFGGAGTTGLVAARHGRHAILCELNPDYADLAHRRIAQEWGEAPKAEGPIDHGPLFL